MYITILIFDLFVYMSNQHDSPHRKKHRVEPKFEPSKLKHESVTPEKIQSK